MAELRNFYYRYLGSRMIISVIFNAFQVFFLWRIVEQYHSVFLAGLIATISLAVSIVSSIPIGHLIDRMNSTLISLISSVASTAGLIFLAFGSQLPFIYITAGFLSLGFTMKGDSFSAIMKKHLPEDQFLKGNSLSQAGSFVSTLIGTVLGGLAILYFGNQLYLILIALAVASAITSAPIAEASSRESGSSAAKELASSISFYRKILGLVVVAFILNGLFESLDVYSSGLFHLILRASPLYYTAFIASIPIGGIFGSWLSGKLNKRVDKPLALSLLVLCYAPIFILLGISGSAIFDVGLGLSVGILLPVINIPLQTRIMKIIPRNIYGKVMAFLRIFLGGSTPAMAAVLSFVSIFLRVDTIFLYIGFIMLPVTALSFLMLPKLFALGGGESTDATISPTG